MCKRWQKTLKLKLNLKRDYQAQVHSVQMVLLIVRQGGQNVCVVAKDSHMKAGKQL
jgi:hypothetical protein